jgi:hypothetical protein
MRGLSTHKRSAATRMAHTDHLGSAVDNAEHVSAKEIPMVGELADVAIPMATQIHREPWKRIGDHCIYDWVPHLLAEARCMNKKGVRLPDSTGGCCDVDLASAVSH